MEDNRPTLTQGVVLEYIQTTNTWFDLRQLDRELSIESPKGKTHRRQILHRLCQEGLVERHPSKEGVYRLVDNTIQELDFLNADAGGNLKLNWPTGEDDTDFRLSCAKVYPQSTMLVAGPKNSTKTLFCLQFMFRNLDSYPCIYHTSEMSAEEIAGRLQYFTWVDWKQAFKDGKFKMIERFDNYQDVVKQYPNSIHIIDWIDPGENPYMIGAMIKNIRQRLGKGIALIAIQKKQTTFKGKDGVVHTNESDYGTGGQYSEHLARLVIHLGYNSLWIKSCKAWQTEDINSLRFTFDVTGHGSKYCNIQKVDSK